MPYIPAGRRRAATFLSVLTTTFVAIALGCAALAQAAPPPPAPPQVGPATQPNVSACSQQTGTQAFLSASDFNYYAPAPAANAAGFDGSTWWLSGGANVVSTQLADGSTGQALDLPQGSVAVSPDICVTPSSAPQFRALVRSLQGGGNVQVSVSYYTSAGWTNPQGAGGLNAQNNSWSVSNPQNLPNPPGGGPPPPGGSNGPNSWQAVRFILTPGGPNEYQVYGLGLSAPAPTPNTAQCSNSTLAQAYLSSGDFNYYAAVPAANGAGFDGSTWTLAGGANVATAQLADGTTGPVVDLPQGSIAESPDVCVNPSASPAFRSMVRSLQGGGNVQVSVSFYSSGGWTNPQGAGGLKANPGASWAATNAQNLPGAPGGPGQTGWEVVRFILTPGGSNEYQVYGLADQALPPAPSTGPCSNPVLTQAFLSTGDTNYYTPAPGMTGGALAQGGWTLTGGAQILTTTLADGTTGPVLDLPAGSMAVSPNICVTSLYPTARMMVRSVNGGDDLSFGVSYAGTNSWTNPQQTGHLNGNANNWTLSQAANLQPSTASGWQIVRLVLTPDGGHSEFQVYDLQLDPYAKG
jgi:hypothetical protein